MATPSDSSVRQSAAIKSIETRLWVKRIAYAILAVIIVALSAGQLKSCSKTDGGEDWGPVSLVTSCTPVWNEKQGWCDIGKFPTGTYRIVPKFETWQMKLEPSNPPQPTDLDSLPIPPQGIDAQTYLGSNEKMGNFLRSAFVKSRNYGSIVIKTSELPPFEAFSPKGPREFKITKETNVLLNVNLPAFPINFSGNQGQLAVELQKLAD